MLFIAFGKTAAIRHLGVAAVAIRHVRRAESKNHAKSIIIDTLEIRCNEQDSKCIEKPTRYKSKRRLEGPNASVSLAFSMVFYNVS